MISFIIALFAGGAIASYTGLFDSIFGSKSSSPATTDSSSPDLLEKKVGELLGSKEQYDYYPQLGIRTSHNGVEVKIDPSSKNPIITIKEHGRVTFDKELTALINAYDTAGKDFTLDAKTQKYSAGSSYEFDAKWTDDHVLKMQGVSKPIFSNDFS